MKKNNIKKALFALMFAVMLCLSACAQTGSFEKTRVYGNEFYDVPADAWYAGEVASAYELGFVDGVSSNSFSPDTTVTVSQGITMASRVHAVYNGKTIGESKGANWYDVYVDYAKKNGIITENQFDDYTRDIKRYEMAELFHDAMGKSYYNAVNDVDYIPDVPVGAMYTDKLLTLYNAGVVMGNDEYGCFNPQADIKRSECAAIIGRVAIPENRLKKTLSDFTSENAYVLCYNVGMGGSKEGINSGWVLDNRGGTAKTDNTGAAAIGDVSKEYATCFIREFNYIPKGTIVLETVISAINDGAFLEYLDVAGNVVYQLKIRDGKLNVLTKGGYTVLDTVTGTVQVRAYINLDDGKSITYINDKNLGTHELLSDNVMSYRVGMDEEGMGTVTVSSVNMVVNYAMYENFDVFGTDSSYGWTKTGSVLRTNNQITMSKDSSLSKSFAPVDGTVCAEAYFIAPAGSDFEIGIGNVLYVESIGGRLCADGKVLYKSLTKNMWYRLRVEASIDRGTADVFLNGRSVGKVNLRAKEAVSDITFSAKGSLIIDNVNVFTLHEYPDYVPVPETRASFDDYIVGLNICSLWRNGTHYGWACISAHDEPTPVIGYYDEGNPESADWEIKYMVEHGIDFQAFCWYADNNSAPLKFPSNCEQLHNGYMYAEYSDYMKYCILWEAANAAHFDSAYFRKHVVPYWFENYFLDPRYVTIDNQLLLPIFGTWHLATKEYFGSVDGVKAEFDYLEEVARSYGFDGFLFFSTGSSSDQLAMMGFDGAYAYNWGTEGKKLEHNKTSVLNSAKNPNMYTIPTISVGFDSIPWHGLRHGNMSVEDFAKAQEWVKKEYLPKYSSKYDWADNFMWLSTWNEYGEGTYIMPSGLNGFGYVDVVREAYTELPKQHEDVVPTLKQKERITHLYPQYARLLRRDGWYYINRTDEDVEKEPKNKLYINDVDIQNNAEEMFFVPAKLSDGRVLFPFNPSTAVNFVLGSHYEYRKEAGTLKIMAHGHEVVFEKGSDRYVLDGVEKDLGYTVEMFDGLLMLDFESLGKDLGYKTETKDGNVYIYTDTFEKLWKARADRKTGTWEFNSDYDNEGFSSSSMTLVTSGGSMKMTTLSADNNDPISFYMRDAFPEDFYTKKFTSVEVRCRYKYSTPGGSRSNLSFYYITDLDETYAENKNIRIYFDDLDSEGEWVTLKYDLTKEGNWQVAERLTGLRFDPFNGQGEIEIDYIRFIEDPDFKYVPVEERPIEIINGDAEGNAVPFYSDNAYITRVIDPDDSTNHVWKIETYDGENYTYFRFPTRFKENTSYKIDYDIRLIGSNSKQADGPTQTSFNTNFRYADKGAFNDFDHVVRTANVSQISVDDGWVHYSATYTVTKIDNHERSEFSLYTNPKDGFGFSYYLDNIVVTETPAEPEKKESFDWGKAKGTVMQDFEGDGTEYSLGNCESEIKDGILELKATSYDVQLIFNNINVDTSKYSGVAVRFKPVPDSENINASAQLFYATEQNPTLDETKSVHVIHSKCEPDEEGYITAYFNLAESGLWKGKATILRFDPANAKGTYLIDKIMLVK